jgi:D-citramalate synthase
MKDGRLLRSRALDADQTEAAIKATIKMLNQIEPEFPKVSTQDEESEITK